MQAFGELINSTLSLWTKNFGRDTLTVDIFNEMITLSGQWKPLDLLIVSILVIAIRKLKEFVNQRLLKPIYFSFNTSSVNEQRAVESGWRLIFHSLLTIAAGVLLTRHGWGKDKLFQDYDLNSPMSNDFHYFFVLQLAYYFYSFYNHLFVEEPHKDRHVMTVHHIVTILLVGFVLVLKVHRVGTLITFLHDINDIVMESCKFLYYLGLFKWSNVAGVVLGFSWPLTRLVVFPLVAIGAAVEYISRQEQGNYLMLTVMTVWAWMIFAMNAYWFLLIVKIIGKSFVNRQPIEDPTLDHEHRD